MVSYIRKKMAQKRPHVRAFVPEDAGGVFGKAGRNDIMANEKNLKPIRDHTRAEELGRRGGQRSGQARRRKKEFRDVFAAILPLEISDELGEEVGLDFKQRAGSLTAAQAMANRAMPARAQTAKSRCFNMFVCCCRWGIGAARKCF